jgi:translation initiation factor 2 subunit 1
VLNSKSGFPEEGEVVYCKVSKIEYHSVFVDILDYERKQGMIHISEVSPGRIRNLRDYVQPDKVIICKVLRIKKDRGHIDLSLRRVSEIEKRNKADTVKQEQKAEKLLEFFCNQNKLDFKNIYNDMTKKAFKEYEYLFHLFEDVSFNDVDISEYFDNKLAEKLTEFIKEKVKPKELFINGEVELSSYESNGLEIVKKILKELVKKFKNLDINYLGAGKYKLKLQGLDYKDLEKDYSKVQKFLDKACGSKANFVINRIDE